MCRYCISLGLHGKKKCVRRKPFDRCFPSAEHLDYNFNNNSCDEDKMCGHYTQVPRTHSVWFSRVVRTSHINKNIAVMKHFLKNKQQQQKNAVYYIYI